MFDFYEWKINFCIQENFKNQGEGEERFLLATRNFCWLPTFFKFLELWALMYQNHFVCPCTLFAQRKELLIHTSSMLRSSTKGGAHHRFEVIMQSNIYNGCSDITFELVLLFSYFFFRLKGFVFPVVTLLILLPFDILKIVCLTV